MRHLRRLLRDYLNISEPLTEDMYGYSFTFSFSENGMGYIMDGAECILDAVLETGISGRCEIYSGEQFTIPGRYFTVSVALRINKPGSKTPGHEYWGKLLSRVTEIAKRFPQIRGPKERMSEMAEKRAMKAWLLYCGGAEIREGEITKIIDMEEAGNFVSSYLERKTQSTEEISDKNNMGNMGGTAV